MQIGALEWDDYNIKHIAEHNINPEEVEDVCFGLHISRKIGSKRSKTYMLAGQTDAGRYLNVVIQAKGEGIFRPGTAFGMNDSHKRRYKKRTKRIGGKQDAKKGEQSSTKFRVT